MHACDSSGDITLSTFLHSSWTDTISTAGGMTKLGNASNLCVWPVTLATFEGA